MRMTLHATYDNVSQALLSPTLFVPYSEAIFMDRGVAYNFPYPYKFPEHTRIKCSVVGEANAQVESTLRGHLDAD